MSVRHLSQAVLLAVSLLGAAQAEPLQFVGTPKLEITSGAPAQLAATRRVAIANLVLEVQTKVKAEYVTGRLSKVLLHRDNTSATNTLKGYSIPALQAAADQLHAQLVQRLTAAGFEVVPTEELARAEGYQELQKSMGYPSGHAWSNEEGNSFLVSPAKLPIYLPNVAEMPSFSNNKKGVGAADEPSPGFGAGMKRAGEGTYFAGREVALAKALNAHLLKAWYVVGFGEATAETGWDGRQNTLSGGGFSTTVTQGATQSTSANAQLYLRQEATRLALRHPGGDTAYVRTQSMPGGQRANDGDLVIRLDETVIGAADFLAGGGVQKKAEENNTSASVMNLGLGLLKGLAGQSGGLGDSRQDYVTQADPERFAQRSAEVIGWVQDALVARLKP
ncbi:hypothetical protein KAK06_08905 [Ideonella sp. 4Y11]|uniref:DUF4410 domain-containing protein n=1 Tax=Ideonella aquatica TaxID=2824119 RepID=A0A940YNB8_9BURK|nr:hypothetical protein [Ideonella aquatica]MBQ0959078.1 hypothetical protein [Ideonella aquatica]